MGSEHLNIKRYSKISKGLMTSQGHDVVMTKHAYLQAIKRDIHPEQIVYAIRHGRVERFGKNYMKYQTKEMCCVGEIVGLEIRILTVTRR